MRVGFNARLLAEPTLRGFNRYAINLLIELGALGVKLYLYSDRAVHASHLVRLPPRSYELRESGKLHYLFWEQGWLPSQCRKDKLDIFHSPFDFGVPLHASCPTFLTIHDAIGHAYIHPRQSFRQRISSVSLKSAVLQWTARKCASHVFTVSNHAKGDLIRCLGIPAERITVTPGAADPQFSLPISQQQLTAVLAKYSFRNPYVFYTGGWEARKNLSFLLRGFSLAALPNVDLVLAGGTSEPERLTITKQVDSLGLTGRVRLLGWISDDDLRVLYRSALCFAYPSEYEGFGLQLCEAMATGCPIVCANGSSLPEVLGNGGELFDLNHPNGLACLLASIGRDSRFRENLKDRARARGASFNWNRTAQLTLEAYEMILDRFKTKDHVPN